MPPSKVFLGLKMGKLDAGFCCEQFPAMGEALGFNVLLAAQDLWPDMQGSVLIVKEDLLNDHPEIVSALVEVTARGIQYIHQHPDEAARIAAHELTITGGKVFPLSMGKNAADLDITPKISNRFLEMIFIGYSLVSLTSYHFVTIILYSSSVTNTLQE